MPVQQAATNAAHIAENTNLLDQLTDLAKIVGPFIAVIIGLVTWAWSRMERSQDKLEKALVSHIEENDRIHDKVFTEIRETSHKLDELIGEHKGMTRGGNPHTRKPE